MATSSFHCELGPGPPTYWCATSSWLSQRENIILHKQLLVWSTVYCGHYLGWNRWPFVARNFSLTQFLLANKLWPCYIYHFILHAAEDAETVTFPQACTVLITIRVKSQILTLVCQIRTLLGLKGTMLFSVMSL